MLDTPKPVLPLALTVTERRILDSIRSQPGCSRARLAEELGLSKAMLSKSVGRFIDLGLVTETREAPAAGERGQPALRLEVNSAALVGVGINLSTRGLHLAAVDFNCNVLETLPLPLPRSLDADSVNPIVERGVSELLGRHLAEGASCTGVGIAVRGFVDRQERIVEVTPTQRDIPYDAVRRAVRDRFDLPVYFESFPQAFFEASQPNNRHRAIFHMIIGYGIGGVLAEGTRLYRGSFNQAGNIGALMPDTRPRPALPDLAAYLGVAVTSLSNERLNDMLRAEDERLLAWFDTRAPALSMPLSAVVQLFNPELIVLGGEMPRAYYERMIPHIDLSIFDHEGRVPLRKPVIRVSMVVGEVGRAQSAASIPIARLLG